MKLCTKTASHQYLSEGTKTIRLEVKDTGELTDTGTHQVTVVLSGRTVTDIDGNIYRTVTIGTQVWMAENLKSTHYRNGDTMRNVTDDAEWYNLSTGAYCNYDNDVDKVATYGRLYNWFVVDDSRNVAPVGWHVPTDEEWETLVDYLGGWDVAGGKMKTTGTIEEGTGLWHSPNAGATNESGFSALPGGSRNYGGRFGYLGDYADFWSSTEYEVYEARNRDLLWDDAQLGRSSYYKAYGFSVRCVRD